MFKKITMILFLTVASFVHASTNDSSKTQTKPDIKVDIQGDTRHGAQSEVRTSRKIDEDTFNSDGRIQAEIVDLIQNKFRRYNVNIRVSQGNVLLKGHVQSDKEKGEIESEVRKIKGVKNVDNRLDVNDQ